MYDVPRRRALALRRAVLLAAGRGTRLGAQSEQTPKCLLPVNGRALLDRHLDALAEAGIDDITVVAGFMADVVVRHVAGRCRVLINDAFATTNSITSLYLAAAQLRGHDFLFQNADVLYQPALVQRFVESPHENACLVDPLRPFRDGEYHVELSAGRIVRYSTEVPPELSVGESAQLVRVGARDSGAFFDRLNRLIESGGATGFPNQAYDTLMNGDGLWPVFTAGLHWWEVDTAAEYDRCCAESANAPPEPAPGTVRPAITLERIGRFVRQPHTPWGFRWVAPSLGSLAHRPLDVARQVRAYRAGRLSLEGLDLAVNGARFLRLAQLAARAAGFEPLLLWGTLLGCLREGGFIAGDLDIDLGIKADDAHRMAAYRALMLGWGFTVRVENAFKLSLVHPRHPRLFVDLDVIRPHRDGWAITNAEADPRRRFHYHFPMTVFAGSTSARFADRLEVAVPADAEGFLTAVYGQWRKPRARVHYLYGPLNLELEIIAEPQSAASSATPGVAPTVDTD